MTPTYVNVAITVTGVIVAADRLVVLLTKLVQAWRGK